MSVTGIDKHSKTWKVVAEWCDEKLESLRNSLESPQCEEYKAHFLRGQILLIKELRALGNLDD